MSMENEEVKPEVVNEAPVEEAVEQVEEVVEEPVESEREKNLKAEARRKQEELIRLREENERLRNHQPANESENIDRQLRNMSDRELEAYLNNAQYSNLHINIREILDERRFDRYQAKKEESRLKLDAEIEVESKFPEVLNPAHPLALRTKELMRLHRLENHPQGRLIAALAAGRKKEQKRQADVKANFAGRVRSSSP
jgi:predicted RNase H-like nuclease (RuvC/YqgF family)